MAKKQNKTFLAEIFFVAALLLFISSAFFTFLRDNSRRIIEQNNSFIKTATIQTADRIDDLLDLSQHDVQLLAHLYPSTMEQPVIDSALLKDMTERSSFDYVEFISTDGIDLTADGRTADLSDREYFQSGMRGESGMCVIYNSRITNETLLIFYTPFYYQDEIIGVLTGVLRGDSVLKLLSYHYFDVECSSYLIKRDGTVVFSSGDSSKPDNLLQTLQEKNRLSHSEYEKLVTALQNGTATTYNYTGSNGEGSAYVAPITNSDWMLVQNFHSSLTRAMTQQANSAGIRLEVKLIIAFLAYVVFLLFKNHLQRKQLVTEKQEMSHIVDAVTQLFTRFALVDFQTDFYQYLDEQEGSVPEQGSFSDLIAVLRQQYIREDDSEPMDVVIAPEYVQQHLTPDVPYLQFEYQIDNNGLHWENISILCLRREEGLPVRVLYAIQDVTALKEREHEIRLALKSASEAAEAANHAKSDFLARMSHDIRTPMNAIMGMTAVAAMHLDDRDRLTDCLNKITISSRHLLALINDVLDMAKIESGKVTLSSEPFNMADMVESIVTILRPQTNAKHQHFRIHISDITHENVIGDTLRLRQIFVNILGNAVKFTPEEGTIIFSIRELPSLVHGMACYEFRCEDTGIGMDESFLKTIFDPFSRAKHSHNIEGTGLGMSITRNIVRMMQGDIQVESEPGVGSVFTVQVHLKLQELEAEDVGELADLRVLVADDDQDSCIAACDILHSIGMCAEWVLSGAEAVEKTLAAHEQDRNYSAVILDWKMPGQDGIETARQIRAKVGDHVPIIILSAYDWTQVEAEARDAGIQAFVEKPLFRSRLVYALKSVLEQESQERVLSVSGLEEVNYSGRHVLLVEDNELNREIAQELLSLSGVRVDQAENGKIAVQMVADSEPNDYDLIFMDIQMPVMDGYEAARRIRALAREDAKRVPIIAMTANAFADDIRSAHEAGMNDHIAKPVEIGKLLEALHRWL